MEANFKKISIIGLGLIGSSLLHAIKAKSKGVVTYAFDISPDHRKIISEMKIATFVCDNIHEAVKEALQEKEQINVIFSPCASSFDQFKNFEERGDFFKKIVKKRVKIEK